MASTVPALTPRVKESVFCYNTGVASLTRAQPIRLEARPGRLIALDAAGLLLGAAVLVAARLVPQLVSPLAFWLLIAALVSAFAVDFLVWFVHGVRAIELDGDALVVRRGRERSPERIERASVSRVRTRRSWGGRVIELRLRRLPRSRAACRTGKELAALVARLLRRDRVQLREDAFDRSRFSDLAGLLAGWNRRDS